MVAFLLLGVGLRLSVVSLRIERVPTFQGSILWFRV